MTINQYLKHEGYNLRERLNIYGGTAMAALYPTAFLRYALLRDIGGDYGSLSGELVGWGLAALFNAPFLFKEFLVGTFMGTICADSLSRSRLRKESGLDKTIDVQNLL